MELIKRLHDKSVIPCVVIFKSLKTKKGRKKTRTWKVLYRVIVLLEKELPQIQFWEKVLHKYKLYDFHVVLDFILFWKDCFLKFFFVIWIFFFFYTLYMRYPVTIHYFSFLPFSNFTLLVKISIFCIFNILCYSFSATFEIFLLFRFRWIILWTWRNIICH